MDVPVNLFGIPVVVVPSTNGEEAIYVVKSDAFPPATRAMTRTDPADGRPQFQVDNPPDGFGRSFLHALAEWHLAHQLDVAAEFDWKFVHGALVHVGLDEFSIKSPVPGAKAIDIEVRLTLRVWGDVRAMTPEP